jgi:hypothetical protein
MEEKLKVGKIYKIIDNTNGNIYIGSTTQKLNIRLNEHKSEYNRYLKGKSQTHCTSFEIIKNNDYRIEIIKYVIYKDKIELHLRERYYIENNECVNIVIPLRTRKEWRNDNKDYIKEWRNDNKEYHKDYYNNNKEHYKDYYNNNKEHYKIKYQCECGSSIGQSVKQKHFRTLKHINFINSN